MQVQLVNVHPYMPSLGQFHLFNWHKIVDRLISVIKCKHMHVITPSCLMQDQYSYYVDIITIIVDNMKHSTLKHQLQ
jgi:hypothetical protein